MNAEIPYLYWLYSVNGIGAKTLKMLKKYVGNARNIYDLSEYDLSWFLNRTQVERLMKSRMDWDIEGEYAKLGKAGISFYPLGYPGYPDKLINIPDPPAALFVKGSLPDPALPSAALIGTRKCSGYGNVMAKQLGEALAKRGVLVISGMARGIDGIGQRAVCEAGGRTYAVLGCGVDIVYPQENGRLYEKLILKGGIISEYIPGTEPRASLFPPRNRIISGLSDTVIVVEAKEKSGTMITVDMALEQGREVYAIPGRVIDGLSCGCNRLIKQGAGLIISIDEFIDDILKESKRKLTDEVNDLKKEGHNKKTPSPLKQTVSLTKEEQPVYAALDYIPRSIEQISAICPQVTFESLLKILITFCLKGIALQMGAGYYCRREK